MTETLLGLQSVSPAPIVVTLLAVAAMLLIGTDPVLGRRQYRAFLAELAADPTRAPDVQVRFYRSWTRQGWLWAAGVLALVVALPGIGLADLGLRRPSMAGLDGIAHSFVTGLLAGLVGALVVSVVVAVVASRYPGRRRPLRRPAGDAALLAMLPTTARTRRGWAALAVTAGVTEEVTYRGLVVLVLALVLGDAHPVAVVLVAATLFGAAHWYQGWRGMLATGALGCVLTGLYLATGSLLIPMVAHVLLDLRPLLTPAAGDPVNTAPQPIGDPA